MLPLDQMATPIVNEGGFTIIGVAVLKDRAHDRAKDRGLGKARAQLGSRGLHDRKRLIDGGSGLGSDRLGWVHDRKRLIDGGSGSRSDRIGWVHDRKRLIDGGSGSRSDRIGCRA